MSRKKVLLISYYWPPSGGAGVQRWVKFCKYLPEFEIEPVVLTVKNGTYPVLDQTLADDIPKELKVYHSKSIEPYTIFAKLTGRTDDQVSNPSTAFSMEGSWMQNLGVWIRSNFFIPDARIGWIPATISKALDIIQHESIDTIITTGPPNSTHIIGTKLKNRRPELEWIMDMRDPWSRIFYNETLPRTTLAQNIDETLERNALKTADEVIVVSEHMAELQKRIFDRPYHIIANGFDHQDLVDDIDTSPDHVFTIKYIGSMTEQAIPYQFFKALASLTEGQKERIALDFFGSYNNKVYQAIDDNGLNDLVYFKGYVPHLEAKAEMKSADLLLLGIPDTKENELILTGKLFDYIAAQTPILYIGPKNGDAATIIKDYQLGVCFDYSEVNAMNIFLSNTLNGAEIPYKKWDSDFKSHPFSRFSLTEKLVNVIL